MFAISGCVVVDLCDVGRLLTVTPMEDLQNRLQFDNTSVKRQVGLYLCLTLSTRLFTAYFYVLMHW